MELKPKLGGTESSSQILCIEGDIVAFQKRQVLMAKPRFAMVLLFLPARWAWLTIFES
jgi:hypothetical protein